MSRGRNILAALVALASAANVQAQDTGIEVHVTAIAGAHAYVSPGRSAGVRAGGTVTFEGVSYPVEVVAEDSASLRVGSQMPFPLALDDVGRFVSAPDTDSRGVDSVEERSRIAPRPLRSYQGQWPRAERPSDSQAADYVSLGSAEALDRRLRLVLTGAVLLQAPLGSTQLPYTRSEVRARLQARPWQLPLSFDVDAALQLWLGGGIGDRVGAGSRPVVRVRALQAVYGEGPSFYAALGRLRYAAPMIGVLDGASVRSPQWKGVRIGAFGGLPPDPRSGLPSVNAARFGVIAEYEDSESALRPSTTLVVHGSVFDGALDERRLNWSGAIFPGPFRFGGHLEASLYDATARFTSKRFEVSAAGADVDARFGDFGLRARFDMRRPERSRWLDAQLPPGWLCLATPSARIVRELDFETCTGDDARYVASLAGRYQGEFLRINVGGTVVHTTNAAGLERASLYASMRRLMGLRRTTFVEASVSAGGGLLLANYSAGAAAGGLLWNDTLELSGRYRGTVAHYRADLGYWNQHRVGVSAEWRGPAIVRLDVDAWLAPDVQGISSLLSASWVIF